MQFTFPRPDALPARFKLRLEFLGLEQPRVVIGAQPQIRQQSLRR